MRVLKMSRGTYIVRVSSKCPRWPYKRLTEQEVVTETEKLRRDVVTAQGSWYHKEESDRFSAGVFRRNSDKLNPSGGPELLILDWRPPKCFKKPGS